MAFRLGLFVLLAASLAVPDVSAGSGFQRKVKQHGDALNKAFHKNLLKQLAKSKNSTNSSHSLNHVDLSVPAGGSNFQVLDTTSSTLQIYTQDTLPTDPAPSEDCATALTASLACNDSIPLFAVNPYMFSDSLSTMCTTDCAVALDSYRAGVVSACGDYEINGSGGITYAPTLAVDYVAGPYTVQCLQDPDTLDYCGPLLQTFNGTGGLLSLPTNELCSYCTLETLNKTLSNPTTYSVAIAGLLSQAVTACGPGFSSYNVSSAPGDQVTLQPGAPGFGEPGSTDPTLDCAILGRNVTTTSDTTCADVAGQYSVSEYDVFNSNPFLSADCTIPSGTTLCVPQACTTYTIATDDTCDTVAAAAQGVTGTAITSVQLQSFNPDLGTYCQLMPLRVGKDICLTPNGGFPDVGATSDANPSATPTTFAPIPTPTVDGTTSNCGKYYQVVDGDICQTVALANGIALADFLTLNPEVDANCTNLWLDYYYCVAPYPPFSTATVAPSTTTIYSSATIMSYPIPTDYTVTWQTITLTTAGIPAPTNVADGTRTVSCGNYYTIADGDTIESVADMVGVSTDDLQSWNPELSSGSLPAVGEAICVLFPRGTYTLYPVPRPTNAYENATSDCAEFYTVESGDGCGSIEEEFALTNEQFDTLNPGLASDCTNLILGIAYCVFPTYPISQIGNGGGTAPPTNVATGTITDGCTQYYTVVSGDSCSAIDTTFGISFTQFTTWNPEVDENCSNIQVGEAYCVASSTGGSTGPPSNVATGTITDGCSQYYTVASGDTCSAIDTTFGITFTQFQTWNPEVNEACSNIQVGLAYCVASTGGSSGSGPPSNVATGTITDGCTQYYTVVSGDSCSAIDTTYSITFAQFRTWNPEVDENCSNIQVGEAYCVASTNTGSGGTPSNLASGSFTNCSTYYTVVSGDSCTAIDTTYNLALADFYRWNPEVNTDCTNIGVGEAYCVQGGGRPCAHIYTVQSGDSCFAITQSQGISQSDLETLNPFLGDDCALSVGENLCLQAGSDGPPSNIASGSLTTCSAYHTVVSGDSCVAMESTYNLAARDLYAWNPEINTDCTNIAVDEAYCVAGGGSPCGTIYTVQSGDFCFAITQSQDITQQQLNDLNPFLDANCDLIVGENLCVG